MPKKSRKVVVRKGAANNKKLPKKNGFFRG
jgi:hypothetical protein